MNKKKTKSTAYGNWECKCSTIFRTRKEFFEHRKTCVVYQNWAKDCRKRSAETIRNKFKTLTKEEKEQLSKECSEKSKK